MTTTLFYSPRTEPWELTGRSAFRIAGIFRKRLVLRVEEARWAFRPVVTGHTPDNWRREKRWIDARPADLAAITANAKI